MENKQLCCSSQLPQHVSWLAAQVGSLDLQFFGDSTYLHFLPDIVQMLQSLRAKV